MDSPTKPKRHESQNSTQRVMEGKAVNTSTASSGNRNSSMVRSQRESFVEYDSRRLTEARFLVWFLTLVYIILQIPNTLRAEAGSQQEKLMRVYWGVSLLQICILVASYRHIRIVTVGVFICFFRLLSPLFDIEDKKHLMDPRDWHFLVANQGAIALFTILVCINCIHSYEVVIGGGLMTCLYIALADAVWGLDDFVKQGFASVFDNCAFSIIGAMMFLYTQKRVHKEIFLEMREKTEHQAEFKTIFDEFDSAVCVFKQGQLTYLNISFRGLLSNLLGDQFMKEVSQAGQANDKRQKQAQKNRLREGTLAQRFSACFRRCCRRRQQLEEQCDKHEDAIDNLLKLRIFLPHSTEPDVQRRDKLTLSEVLHSESARSKIFRLDPEDPSQQPLFVQVKKKEYEIDENLNLMVQIIDVSHHIYYQQAHAENEFLAIINATVSHELRNPLQSIVTHNFTAELCLARIERLVASAAFKEEAQEIIEELRSSNKIQEASGSLMEFLVDDLLDFSQIKTGKFRKTVTDFDLHQSIAQVFHIHKGKAALKGVDLCVQYSPSSEADEQPQGFCLKRENSQSTNSKAQHWIRTDCRRLQQVLLNLQNNALKFTDEGGTVEVSYTTFEEFGEQFVQVKVTDTGLGIKKEDQGKLFKLFGFVESTEQVNTRGIGLGLVISKRICEQFGGSIEMKSEWGVGSEFSFRFKLESSAKDEMVEEMKVPAEENSTERGCLEIRIAKEVRTTENLKASIQERRVSRKVSRKGNYNVTEEPEDCYSSPYHFINQSFVKLINTAEFSPRKLEEEEEVQQKMKILLVDDEPFNIESLKIILGAVLPGGAKDRIDIARNGQQALDTFKQASNLGIEYSLILMDCNMPQMDGYTSTALIKAWAKKTCRPMPYVVAVTAHSEEKYKQRCLEAGMDEVLPKPARAPSLKAVVERRFK